MLTYRPALQGPHSPASFLQPTIWALHTPTVTLTRSSPQSPPGPPGQPPASTSPFPMPTTSPCALHPSLCACRPTCPASSNTPSLLHPLLSCIAYPPLPAAHLASLLSTHHHFQCPYTFFSTVHTSLCACRPTWPASCSPLSSRTCRGRRWRAAASVRQRTARGPPGWTAGGTTVRQTRNRGSHNGHG